MRCSPSAQQPSELSSQSLDSQSCASSATQQRLHIAKLCAIAELQGLHTGLDQLTLYKPLTPSFSTALARTSHIPLYFIGLPPQPCACARTSHNKSQKHDHLVGPLPLLKRMLQMLQTQCDSGYAQRIALPWTKHSGLFSAEASTCIRVRTSARGYEANCAMLLDVMPAPRMAQGGGMPS